MRWGMMMAGLVLISEAAVAQKIPVKMGLWENKITVSDAKNAPETVTVKSCLTPATWEKGIVKMGNSPAGCNVTSVKNAHGYTFDTNCTLKVITMKAHGESTITDPEHTRSTIHTTMTVNGLDRVSDRKTTSRFLSASCGTVKPEETPAAK